MPSSTLRTEALQMRIFGYAEEQREEVPAASRELAEITFVSTPEEARKIAAFLLHAADEMERMGSAYSHIHLSDKQPGFDDSPHVTVFNTANV
jgi:hypothetical protein